MSGEQYGEQIFILALCSPGFAETQCGKVFHGFLVDFTAFHAHFFAFTCEQESVIDFKTQKNYHENH